MDRIRLVDYVYTIVSDKPGEGARLLGLLRDAGVNLLAFTAFPSARKSQVDFVPADLEALKGVLRAAKVRLSPAKKVFLIDGEDRVGALVEVCSRLGSAKINITAIDAVATGDGRWGALLWVKPRDVKRAAAALGVV